MTQDFRVVAPSRLHFGLLAFGAPHARQFGGVGVMIDQPTVDLRIAAANRFCAVGPAAERVCEFAENWAMFHGWPTPPNCLLAVAALPRMHAGLGVGTQLGLAVAWGLNQFVGLDPQTPARLAQSVGRGLRSAVGTYGFLQGGLIAERGKLPQEALASLDERLALPDAWRVVLVCPRAGGGLHGDQEQRAFAELPAMPDAIARDLAHELQQRLLPAARAGDFVTFGDSLFHYGRTSGSAFASVQGSAYNGPRLSQVVDLLRQRGVRGVGQSSWGPTLFAFCEHADAAQSLVESLAAELADCDLHITSICNRGIDERMSRATRSALDAHD